MLFMIYIIDLPGHINSPCFLFADDTKIIRPVHQQSHATKPCNRRLKSLQLPSLHYRRFRGDLRNIFKMVNSPTAPLQSLICKHPQAGPTTRGHHLNLEKTCGLNIRKYSFPQRIINHWNSLPSAIIGSSNLTTFKNRVDQHFSIHKFSTNIVHYCN